MEERPRTIAVYYGQPRAAAFSAGRIRLQVLGGRRPVQGASGRLAGALAGCGRLALGNLPSELHAPALRAWLAGFGETGISDRALAEFAAKGAGVQFPLNDRQPAPTPSAGGPSGC